MAFKAINDMAGPDGLVLILLVYSAYPRIAKHDPLSPSVTQRALVIKKAMAEMQKLQAKRQVNDALSTRNGPSIYDVNNLTINSDVLVWREGNIGQPGSWKGPYKLIAVNGESCILALPHGNTTFRATSVKPYLIPNDKIDSVEAEPTNEPDEEPAPLPAKRPRGRPRKYANVTVLLQDDSQYQASRQSEVLGLLEKGVFEVAFDVPKGIRIFNSRFVDEVKNKGTDEAFMKSRLIV